MVLNWDRGAPAVRDAVKASLAVWDGDSYQKSDLNLSWLKLGSITYNPHTQQSTFQLEITTPDGVVTPSTKTPE